MIAHVPLRLLPVRVRSEDYPQGEKIIDLFKGDVLGLHLMPDGVRGLDSFPDFEIEPGF